MEDKVWQVQTWPGEKYWVIQVDDLPAATQAKTVKQIDVMVRDFISLHLDIDPASVKYQLNYVLPEEVVNALDEATKLRVQAELARKEAAAATTRAARILKAQGLTVRDIGAALGVSFQRAHQMLSR
jgi:hypothetical protein